MAVGSRSLVISRRASAEYGAAPQCGKGEDRSSLQAVRDGPGRLRCHQGSGCFFRQALDPARDEGSRRGRLPLQPGGSLTAHLRKISGARNRQARAIEPGPGNRQRGRSCSGRILHRAARRPSRSITHTRWASGDTSGLGNQRIGPVRLQQRLAGMDALARHSEASSRLRRVADLDRVSYRCQPTLGHNVRGVTVINLLWL